MYNIMNVWKNAFFRNVLSSLLVTGLVLVLYFSSKSEIIQNKSRGTFLSLTFNFLRNYLSLETRCADRTDIYKVHLRLDDRRQTIPIALRNDITAIKNCALIFKKTKIASLVLFRFCIYSKTFLNRQNKDLNDKW